MSWSGTLGTLHLLVIPPPPWLIIICNIAAFLLVLVIFVIIIYIRTRPFCITPTEAELNCAKSLRSRRGSTGRVVSSTQASVKHGFSFKDHGDDIGTDMSDEEKESQLKPVDEASSAVPFDPKMVMMNMRVRTYAEIITGMSRNTGSLRCSSVIKQIVFSNL
ncbi:hypothetical protein Q1695_015176 [Nippostrongylus brasiliensis]|nr:hypothetical protein Q1695_015176 [Nippostrongylus brasiliensis]